MSTKQLKYLRSQLAKAERKGDGNAQCQLLSQIGTELSSKGEYSDAVQCHTEQLALCQPFSLPAIEEALAHRQLGECLVMLSNFKEAHSHHNTYLKLAHKCNSKKDIQEALTTVGRTAFLWATALFDEDEQSAAVDWLLFSQQKFLESLDMCDQLDDEISEHDLLDMRSRLYLNLANVFSRQPNQLKEVKAYLMKALNLSKCLVSREIELMVWINLADFYDKSHAFKEALLAAERAAGLAEKLDDKISLATALEAAAQALICVGDFVNGKKYLKRACQSCKGEEEKTDLWKKLSQVVRLCQINAELIRLEEKHAQNDRSRQCGLLEQLGDRCCNLKAYHQAIKFYTKQLKMCRAMGVGRTKVISVLISLAATHSDAGQHAQAVHFYLDEIAMREDTEHKEISQTYCLVASEQLAGNVLDDDVLQSYATALQHAEKAGNLKLQASILKSQADTLDKFGHADAAAKLHHRHQEISADLESSSDDSSIAANDEESSELCLSDSSESEEGAAQVLPRRQQPRVQLTKLDKKNCRGETKLHEATINGNFKLVKSFIQQVNLFPCLLVTLLLLLNRVQMSILVTIVDGRHCMKPATGDILLLRNCF
eukprot:scpid33893/ scgid4390/ Tonsoku-like protein; NF-kappa-B inhibitor-like protein 2; Nuclear factor of kappa light polypeptide gene enhancer in B-cells inhibitor-like 2